MVLAHGPPTLRIPAFATRVFLAGLQHRPQLIISTHANFTPAARPLKRLAGIPYWAVAHGFEVWDLKRDAVRRGLQEADRILAVSHYTRQRLLAEQALSPAQVSRLPNTFELERFRPAPKPTYLLEKYGLQPDQPICLTVNPPGHRRSLSSLRSGPASTSSCAPVPANTPLHHRGPGRGSVSGRAINPALEFE
jgi:glycosyltransferase involved in cell wall biosynthesis